MHPNARVYQGVLGRRLAHCPVVRVVLVLVGIGHSAAAGPAESGLAVPLIGGISGDDCAQPSSGGKTKPLKGPRAVASGPDGSVYVTDNGHGVIRVLGR